MSEPVVCPVCETPNDPENSHCEVCGERLTPAEPGEELAPEENVAAAIEEEGGEAPDEFEAAESDEDFEEPEFEEDGADEEVGEGLEELPLEDEAEEEHDDYDEFEDEAGDVEGDAGPAVLYSPVDGTAYPEGTPEFEEGFGPNGEELVAEPPEGAEPVADAEFEEDGDFDEAEFDEEGYDAEEEAPEEEGEQTSEQFQQMFQPRQPAGGAAEPLPEPGVRATPATLTVYVNRQPVHTHAIETDETLIGRRDPVSDAYPDLDLTELDTASVVSRKHAYIFRQNRNYTLYVVSNSGTQVNSDLLELGQRRALEDGDIIVLAGSIAMKFDLPD